MRRPDSNHLWPDYEVVEAKVGPSGAFFFYSRPRVTDNVTIDEIPRGQSSFYNIINGRQKTLVSGLDFGNGVGYSGGNGRNFYLGDSLPKVIYSLYYDERTDSMCKLYFSLVFLILIYPDSVLEYYHYYYRHH